MLRLRAGDDARDRSTRATIRPGTKDPLAIDFLAFVPQNAAAEEDPERIEALRALGYIEPR